MLPDFRWKQIGAGAREALRCLGAAASCAPASRRGMIDMTVEASVHTAPNV